MSGHEHTIEWRGRRVAAWVPDTLTKRDLTLSEPTARRTERAAGAARRGDDVLPADWGALARLLLRAEGVASSYVEGVTAPLAQVAAAELDPSVGESAVWIADNAAATLLAIDEARRAPLEAGVLHRWHRRLMTGAGHLPERQLGTWRDLPGWIGGTSPLDAAAVVPPPELIVSLMADLIEFANRTDVDSVTQAAVAHAQFELIHPYADGNGRVGRILIAWILARRLNLAPPPPVSVRIATDRGGYLSGLALFRLGQVDPWVAWFAEIVESSGDAATNLVGAVATLRDEWSERLANVRKDATAHRVLALLPAHPVIGGEIVASELSVSERSARTALDTLQEHGILEPFAVARRESGRPRRWWVAAELLALVGAWSR
jgi:DNA-binding transcriptional ArsR family regulator